MVMSGVKNARRMTLAAERVCWIDTYNYDRSGYNRYMSKSKNPITIARAIIRIGDAARNTIACAILLLGSGNQDIEVGMVL